MSPGLTCKEGYTVQIGTLDAAQNPSCVKCGGQGQFACSEPPPLTRPDSALTLAGVSTESTPRRPALRCWQLRRLHAAVSVPGGALQHRSSARFADTFDMCTAPSQSGAGRANKMVA